MLRKVKQFLKKYRLYIIISAFLIAGFIIIKNTFTLKTTSSIWDGSVASSFSSGTGTSSDPYIINDGSELALLFLSLNNESSSDYFNKYYKLNNNIDFDQRDFSFLNSEKSFSGYIDGSGYTLFNFTINNCSELNDNCSYGLFNNLDSATIKNINFKDITINNKNNSNETIALINSAAHSNINNISISNLKYNITNDASYEILSSGLLLNDLGSNNVSNINIDIESNNNNTNIICLNYLDSNFDNILYKSNNLPLGIEIENAFQYDINNNQAIFTKEYSLKTIIESLNRNSEYKWEFSDNNFKLLNTGENEERPRMKSMALSPGSGSINAHASGKEGSTVYVNDLISDTDYYQGLNYSYSENNAYPTVDLKNIYSDNNLVRVETTYNGKDYNGENVGYISPSDNYNKFVYYKVYPINNNGTSDLTDDYVEFELIDNPFAKRPNNKAFNGWITDKENAVITIDMDVYVRNVKVPVTYSGGKPADIKIDFYASWIGATTYTVSANDSWSNIQASLDDAGMKELPTRIPTSNLYETAILPRYSYYPNGSYRPRNNGSTYYRPVTNNSTECNTNGGCPYYYLTSDTTYDPSKTYYEIDTSLGANYAVFNTFVPYELLETGQSAAGLFRRVTILNNNSIDGYYDASGNIQNGTCRTTAGCTYYEFINLKDASGNLELTTSGVSYYKLVTRDTNIVFLYYAGSFSSSLSNTTQTKPFTFTAYNNGTDRRSNSYWTASSAYANKDLRIEWMRINGGTASQSGTTNPSTTYAIFAKYNNLKIGYGVIKYNSNVNFGTVISGNGNTGSSTSATRYRVIVESGFYNNMASVGTTGTYYVNGSVIYGCDYDRVSNINNNLDVRFVSASIWGGTLHSYNNDRGIAVSVNIKSGAYGSNRDDYTTGIYIGGRNSGTIYAPVSLTVEGGSIYNITGGPLIDTSIKSTNIVYLFFKGGTADAVFGGAGTTLTYGNRILQFTGGEINYSVCGGSNGIEASEGDGTLDGSTYIYVGGHAVIGNQTTVKNNTIEANSEIEAGSIFGAGNGNSDSTTIGSVYNSRIVIDGTDAVIRRNVYGGGNYGATGSMNTNANNSSETTIVINGGTVTGSIYGAGNNNGAGNYQHSVTTGSWFNQKTTNYYDVTSHITITQNDGNVGKIYGGSNISGTVYGSANINVYGGTVNEVYGGGEGASTFLRDNIDIVIGKENVSGKPVINTAVYGGSAFGTVNAVASNAQVDSTKHVNVTVNNGDITGKVYGGAKGDNTYTPTVKGNITVNINGGTLSYVYGGFDAKGTPEGNDIVYLNGGTIGSCFGGGNNTGQTTTNVYLRGANVTNLYGGSNNSGAVTTTNVYVESGNVETVYGGNNIGGTCSTSNVSITGGNILASLYGGGNKVSTTTTNVKIYNTPSITNVFGSGNEAGSTTTNVTTYNEGGTINIGSIYGGANTSGNVSNAYVTINNGSITSVYGGNNAGGVTSNSHVTINNGIITNTFGGGNKASVTNANTTLNGGTITNVYGGGNEAGCTTSNITGANNSTVNVTNVYGGSNQSGNITNSNIIVNSGNYSNIYGGNNAGGITSNPVIVINNGTIGNIYGGGNLASVPTTSVTINNGTVNNVFGGGKQASVNTSSNVYIKGGTINQNVYGGGDEGTIGQNSNVYINNVNILGSAYAGGNGSTATVYGNTNIYVGGNTTVGTSACTLLSTCSVFGGGNAATTGTESADNSVANVNISGATIYGNVYGGANTSKVYGETKVYIGANATTNSDITKGDINITGTVFGGGEANASGSTTYDYNYISVTKKIDVDINGTDYNISILGSIFGSGNASSTSGTSQIKISNYGSFLSPKKTTSIQRTNKLIIDNSSLALSGAADRTNEYSDVLFTLSIIDELDLKNNSTLYLETGTNLFKKLNSLTSDGEKAEVDIDTENGIVTKNVDNRIYMYEGKNLNIATNPNVTAYGQVNGMTFFGMFTYNSLGEVNVGIYNDYEYDRVLSYGGIFTKGSYVIGAHKVDHDITEDGFYSNFIEEGTNKNKINYINPVPEDASYYMWVIGELVAEYDIDLVASKYSTLGAYEFSFTEFSQPNTSFEILGFDTTDLAEGISLVNKASIPKLAEDEEDANSNFALTMESTNSGWLTNGITHFYSDEANPMSGTTSYIGENSSVVPTMLFYLYHSKNISTTGNMGTVRIVLLAVTKTNDLEKDTKRIVINVNLSRLFSTANDYEAALTSGKKYEMFSSTLTNITSKSSLSAYFSLYASGSSIYRTGYHRSLVSNIVLPENTKITMIDLSKNEAKYYYHVINASDVITATNNLNTIGEVYYDLSMFEVMGASNNGVYYSDSAMNSVYYDSSLNANFEEFIFIIDFDDTNITSDMIANQLLFEMHDASDETIFGVLGVQRANMIYNIYNSGDALVDLNGTISTNTIYSGDDAYVDLSLNYLQSSIDNNIIYDTKGYDYKLGTKISLINSDNQVVSGTSLLGLYYEIDGVRYYPNIDGTTRIKLSDRVGNVGKHIKVHTGTSDIATGTYTLKIESYASPDGIYYGINSSDSLEFTVYVINEIYGLDAITTPKEMIIDSSTGLNLNNSNRLTYNIRYNSTLSSPNIHLRVSRRTYDSVYSTTYVPVDFEDYVTNLLLSTDIENEYLVINNPNQNATLDLIFKDNLLNGTYKIEFVLYDGNEEIGSVEKYIIIK